MEYLEYFKNGFQLLRKNLHIYFVAVLLLLVIVAIPSYQVLIKLILDFVNVSFLLCWPKILNYSLQDKSMSYKEIFQLSLKNAKRNLLASILLIIIFIILLVCYLIIGLLLHINPKNLGPILTLIIYMSITISYPFWAYFSIFFSLEEKGVKESFIKSFQFAKKNIKFSYLVAPYIGSLLVISHFLVKQTNLSIAKVIYYLVTIFIGLGISAGFFLFYKKNYRG